MSKKISVSTKPVGKGDSISAAISSYDVSSKSYTIASRVVKTQAAPKINYKGTNARLAGDSRGTRVETSTGSRDVKTK